MSIMKFLQSINYDVYLVVGSINTEGLDKVDMEGLFNLPKNYWVEDIRETRQFLDDQVGQDLPSVIQNELQQQQDRILAMWSF